MSILNKAYGIEPDPPSATMRELAGYSNSAFDQSEHPIKPASEGSKTLSASDTVFCEKDAFGLEKQNNVLFPVQQTRTRTKENELVREGFVASFFRKLCTYILSIVGLWALIYVLLGEDEALSGGGAMSLMVLEVTAILFGKLLENINAPPMLGMLAAGLLLKNMSFGILEFNFTPKAFKHLRATSVVVLLTRGALSVNPDLICKHWKIVPLLATAPCLFESIAVGLSLYFITNLSLSWAALTGSMMSAMSSVLVMQYLNILKPDAEEKNKTMVEIIKAACGLDVILAIFLKKAAGGFVFASDPFEALSIGVVQVLLGKGFGIVWGILIGILMPAKSSVELRTFAVSTGGVLAMIGMGTVKKPRGGPWSVFFGALIAVTCWRRRKIGGENNNDLQKSFTKIWFFFQPLLFGILGTRIDFTMVEWPLLGTASVCILIGYMVRLVTVFVSTSFVPLSLRQRLFIMVAWTAKGTLQAALSPVPLDFALDSEAGPVLETQAYNVMCIATLVVVLGSTLCSISFLTVGRYLCRT